MPNTELAEELLQLEEADAWFEYLESTRGQLGDALRRARAVGVGAALPAACAPCARERGCGLRPPEHGMPARQARPQRRGW